MEKVLLLFCYLSYILLCYDIISHLRIYNIYDIYDIHYIFNMDNICNTHDVYDMIGVAKLEGLWDTYPTTVGKKERNID